MHCQMKCNHPEQSVCDKKVYDCSFYLFYTSLISY